MKIEDITLKMIEEMQHCIGFPRNKVTGTKHRIMYAYRNHYCDHKDNKEWQSLVELELATQSSADNVGITYYYLTEKGFKLLAVLCGFEKIVETD